MRLYVIDNIDSFTYNLVHLCYQVALQQGIPLGIETGRVDQITLDDITRFKPDWILIGPGPGHPRDAKLTLDVLEHYAGVLPIFGVCLGMQAIAYWQGLKVRVGEPVHGKKYTVAIPKNVGSDLLFRDMPEFFDVVRYHSLHVPQSEIDSDGRFTCLANCRDEQHTIMALDFKLERPTGYKQVTPSPFIWGVQFHPESIGTPLGAKLLGNVFQAVVDAQAPVSGIVTC